VNDHLGSPFGHGGRFQLYINRSKAINPVIIPGILNTVTGYCTVSRRSQSHPLQQKVCIRQFSSGIPIIKQHELVFVLVYYCSSNNHDDPVLLIRSLTIVIPYTTLSGHSFGAYESGVILLKRAYSTWVRKLNFLFRNNTTR
jgi:hypothetical protein